MWNDADKWSDHRVQITDMHASRQALADGAADPRQAAEYHAQVRTLAWVIGRMDDADRNGPGVGV